MTVEVYVEDEKRVLGFPPRTWIFFAVYLLLGILIGVTIRVHHIESYIENECNNYIMENYGVQTNISYDSYLNPVLHTSQDLETTPEADEGG